MPCGAQGRPHESPRRLYENPSRPIRSTSFDRFGLEEKRRGSRAFLPCVPCGVAQQKYEFNRCTRLGHPPVSKARSTGRFPCQPFRSGGPWHWKTVRPPPTSAYCGSGDVPKCPPRLRCLPLVAARPPTSPTVAIVQVLPFGQSMAKGRPRLYAFIPVTSFLRKAAPGIKATSSCFALLRALGWMWGASLKLGGAERTVPVRCISLREIRSCILCRCTELKFLFPPACRAPCHQFLGWHSHAGLGAFRSQDGQTQTPHLSSEGPAFGSFSRTVVILFQGCPRSVVEWNCERRPGLSRAGWGKGRVFRGPMYYLLFDFIIRPCYLP